MLLFWGFNWFGWLYKILVVKSKDYYIFEKFVEKFGWVCFKDWRDEMIELVLLGYYWFFIKW